MLFWKSSKQTEIILSDIVLSKKPDSQEFFDVQFVDVSKSEDEHIAIVAFRNVECDYEKRKCIQGRNKTGFTGNIKWFRTWYMVN